MRRLAFVFPGQGSQVVGMGRAWAAGFPCSRQVFDIADEVLGRSLSALCWSGPEDELQLTANTQPAILAASLAVHCAVAQRGVSPVLVAGHSLGEYSALVAAGVLDLADAVRLVSRRGELMQAAVPVGEGAMAALIGADLETARAIAEAAAEDEVCAIANDNAPGQVVISGHKAAVERAIALAPERGIKRSIMLPVSAPFHSPLMRPAAEEMEKALAAIVIAPPRLPLVANVTAAPVSDPDTIRRLLVEQVTGLVRWRESVEAMKERGVDTLVELGAGKVLTGLTKRIDRDLTALAAGAPDEIEVLAKALA
jgi:[acyl-carrier-protein] S-malonyltransferase